MMNTNSNAPRVAVTGYYCWQNSSLLSMIASRPFPLKKIVRQILRPDAAATHAAFMASLGEPPTFTSELVGAGLLHSDELRDELLVDRETVGLCYSASKNEYMPNAFWRYRSALAPNPFLVLPNDTLENGVPRTGDYFRS